MSRESEAAPGSNIKLTKGQELVVGGYTPGNPFDAIIVGYYNGARMKPLITDDCPFVNLPEKKRRTQWALTAEEMKNCVWLKPS